MLGTIAALLALVAGIYFGKITRTTFHAPRFALSTEAINQLFAAELPDADGAQQALSQWRGKTLVINFWATWCPPCREEMPAFSRLQSKYVRKGVQFVGISMDIADNVRKFAHQYQTTYPLLIGNSVGSDLTRILGNTQQALPYTLVLSPANEVLLQRLGRVPEDELDSLLQEHSGLQ